MDSLDFLQKFEEVKAADRMDFMEWASLGDMRERIRDRLTLLKGV
jgi:hypothetical protein